METTYFTVPAHKVSTPDGRERMICRRSPAARPGEGGKVIDMALWRTAHEELQGPPGREGREWERVEGESPRRGRNLSCGDKRGSGLGLELWSTLVVVGTMGLLAARIAGIF